jgi:hypothetical protein
MTRVHENARRRAYLRDAERGCGETEVAALIRYVCDVDHGVPDRHERVATLTVHEKDWAFCRTGGDEDHEWRELVAPDSVENLRSGLAQHFSMAAGTKLQRVLGSEDH